MTSERHFAIGYMRGSIWGLWLGVIGSIAMGIYTERSEFLWLGLFLEFVIPPVWLMKKELEKEK